MSIQSAELDQFLARLLRKALVQSQTNVPSKSVWFADWVPIMINVCNICPSCWMYRRGRNLIKLVQFNLVYVLPLDEWPSTDEKLVTSWCNTIEVVRVHNTTTDHLPFRCIGHKRWYSVYNHTITQVAYLSRGDMLCRWFDEQIAGYV